MCGEMRIDEEERGASEGERDSHAALVAESVCDSSRNLAKKKRTRSLGDVSNTGTAAASTSPRTTNPKM